GSFSFIVASLPVSIEASLLGYKTQALDIYEAPDKAVIIYLEEDYNAIDEVVVVGLATNIKRSNAANQVVRITDQALVGSTTPETLDGALSGKVLGAQIYQNSGAPGGGVSIKLRGVSSINGTSEPFYVLDGVFLNNDQLPSGTGSGNFTNAGSGQDQTPNRIADINPEDIESIEVLKGPSAAAIYGTRANAGVIIIKTKRGKAGKTQINLRQDVGFAQATRLLGTSDWSTEPLGVEQKSKFDYVFKAGAPTEIALWQEATAKGEIYDYEKEIFGNTGAISNTQLSLSGGNEKTKVYSSAGWSQESGIHKKTGFQRGSIRLNVDHQINDRIDFTSGSGYTNSSNQRSFTGNDNGGAAILYALAFTPSYAQLHPGENGIYPASRYTNFNPLEIANRAENTETTNRFVQSLGVNFSFIKNEKSNLKLSLQGGVDYVNSEAIVYFPDDLSTKAVDPTPGASRFSKNRSLNLNLQSFLIYSWKLGNYVDLVSQAGYVRLATEQDRSYIEGAGLAPGQKNPNNGSVRTANETIRQWQDVGLVAQQEFNYADRIIGTLSIRFDKSSLNGDHQKYYPFPRASVAANIANFDFWRIKPINQLKLRLAYGETGGVPSFGNTFTSLSTVVIDGKLGATTPTSIGNAGIEPETASELEGGFDLGLFNNRVSLEFTAYNKKVYNLIHSYALSSGTGVSSIAAYPIGDLRNRGIEVGLSATPVDKRYFSWTTNVQYWSNRSEITRLDIPTTRAGNSFAWARHQLKLGESPTRWYGDPGVPDEEGIVQLASYEDSQPKYQVSWSNTISFLRNFTFAFLLHTSQGNYNGHVTWRHKNTGGTSKDWSEIADRFDMVGVPKGVSGTTVNNPWLVQHSGPYIQDASYIRLREISLYYSVPKSFLSSTLSAISGVKVGVSASNLFTITGYEGYDPEVSNFGNASIGGDIDNSPYPNSRKIFFHLNLNF
ncbi:MAG: SusC/RagA family TonB-linked outer membrane protein, partial [Prevotellaceae bacterium]|nr:SusC/RagA family TonB-linked outer membrane protein [Prevotellaceae bacterium]